MKEHDGLTAEQRAIIHAELERSEDEIVAFALRWPEKRKQLACALLGAAIGVCDTFGVDAEEFIVSLRAKCGKAPELFPPTRGDA